MAGLVNIGDILADVLDKPNDVVMMGVSRLRMRAASFSSASFCIASGVATAASVFVGEVLAFAFVFAFDFTTETRFLTTMEPRFFGLALFFDFGEDGPSPAALPSWSCSSSGGEPGGGAGAGDSARGVGSTDAPSRSCSPGS